MEPRGSEPITRKDKLRIAIFVFILALFPYPFGLLLALGMPLGWVYAVVYTGWVAFAVLLGWLALRRRSKLVSKWPHRRVMYALMGALFLWYALTATVLKVSPALNWFVFILLAVWSLLEAGFAAPEERARRIRLRDAKIR
ncbi:MAG TPA: hypothetical protein VF992_11060 [Thermoplasmata archaeon]